MNRYEISDAGRRRQFERAAERMPMERAVTGAMIWEALLAIGIVCPLIVFALVIF